MELVSVNVARVGTLRYRGRDVRTGIDKRPAQGPIRVWGGNVEGDHQADLRVHGGAQKAAYVYAAEHYPYWKEQLGVELQYGAFGENFTVAGADERNVRIGDVYCVGTALLCVTQPRVPCFKLALHLKQPMSFVARFLESRRTGFYLRVLQAGELEAGAAFERVTTDECQPTIREVVEGAYRQAPGAH